MNPGTDDSQPDGDGFPKTRDKMIERIGEGPDKSSPSWGGVVGEFWMAYEQALTGYVSRRMRARGVPNCTAPLS